MWSIYAECHCSPFTDVYLSHFNGECVQSCVQRCTLLSVIREPEHADTGECVNTTERTEQEANPELFWAYNLNMF